MRFPSRRTSDIPTSLSCKSRVLTLLIVSRPRDNVYPRLGASDPVGRERVFRLRPGINEIEVENNERYRFSRSEHCFQVIADIAGTPKPVDAARRFCARQVGGRRWSTR
jgi:hypothetical protein